MHFQNYDDQVTIAETLVHFRFQNRTQPQIIAQFKDIVKPLYNQMIING